MFQKTAKNLTSLMCPNCGLLMFFSEKVDFVKKKINVIFFTLLLNLHLIKKYRDLFLLTLT